MAIWGALAGEVPSDREECPSAALASVLGTSISSVNSAGQTGVMPAARVEKNSIALAQPCDLTVG